MKGIEKITEAALQVALDSCRKTNKKDDVPVT